MSISLLGIIALQVVWIDNALTLKQQQFDNSVNTALTTLTKKVEEIENNALIKRELFKTLVDTVALTNIETETRITKTPNFQSNITISKTPPKEIILQLDSIALSDTINNVVLINNVVDSFNHNFTINKSKSRKEDAVYLSTTKTDNVKKSFIRVIEEIASAKPSVDVRLNNVHFDSLLNSTLNLANINLAFHATVQDKDSTYWTKDTIDKKGKVFSTPIFPNDVSENEATFNIQFPDSNQYAWSNITTLLATSILFTLVILITFYISIKTLLKQKKISEIKSDFINNMTHEFKTPIATISLAADSINSEQVINNKEKLNYYTSVIKEENERMLSQVENILQISLLDKQELNLSIEKVNLHEALDKAVKNMRLQIEMKDGIINTDYQAHTSTISGDVFHLINVFTNLLDNANKYCETKPIITIHTQNINRGIEISFTDNGIGMKEETIKRVFDKFYRAHTGDIHNVKGFGLGLSYTKAIIEAHNGTIKVKSNYGKGSEFIVFLPIDE